MDTNYSLYMYSFNWLAYTYFINVSIHSKYSLGKNNINIEHKW
jgi:hypothetical protein